MTAPPATRRRTVPQHLMQPKVRGTPKGTLTFDATSGQFELTAHPAVLQLAKRVFPGSAHYVGAKNLRFSATPRSAEDLNWLMLRYPITVQCPRQFAKVRRQALALHEARTQLAALPPVTTPPTFAGELSALQATDVARAIAMQKTLVRWPTGTGKTVMALATIASTNALPALIVVQAPLCRQWELMTKRFLQMPGEVVHVIRGLTPYPLPNTPVHIIHYGLLHAWMDALAARGYRSVHFDEAQELRRTGSMKYSAASLVAADAEYVMGWTATPIYNYGGEIWAVLNAINELCLGTLESFSREWCDGFLTDRLRQPEALGAYLRQEGLMIARSDEEAQGGRLRARRVVHVVDKDDAAYAAKIGAAIALAERYRASTDVLERGRLLRAIDTASRRATGVAKAAAAAAFVRGLVEAGERVLVFAHHHDVYDILEDHLGQLAPALLTGRQTPTEKAEHKRRWVDGETSLAFLALRGSAGLDGMQQRGSVMVFVELDWSPQVHTQCEGRLSARYGLDETLTDLLAYYLVTDTGHDETMQEALGLKIAEYSGLLGLTPEGEEERVLAEQAAERQLDRVIARLQDEGHRRATRRVMPSEAEIDTLASDPGMLGAA